YYIRDSHPGDIALLGARTTSWSFVRRETDWGRTVSMHSYDMGRAGQTRGISEFATVIRDMKMGREYTETALAGAILQSSYAAVLVSQQNYKDALEIIAASPPGENGAT
ncbi:phage portal protein, partial [Microbacteriaceae bacterium K1510]|nr:phage portal protein [Microbacteriaceae bacterium K1510]